MDNEEMPKLPEDIEKSFKESVEIASDLSEYAIDTLRGFTKIVFKHHKEKVPEDVYHSYFIAFLQVLLTEYVNMVTKIKLKKLFESS